MRSAKPEQEGYLYVTYYGDDVEKTPYTVPGCFVLYGFEWGELDPDHLPNVTTDPDEELQRGDVFGAFVTSAGFSAFGAGFSSTVTISV